MAQGVSGAAAFLQLPSHFLWPQVQYVPDEGYAFSPDPGGGLAQPQLTIYQDVTLARNKLPLF